jgi:hypothetical protein
MEWTRSETLAQAAPGCNTCLGLGLRIGRHETTHPCNCVLRAIFRACFEHFRDCVSRERYISKVTLDPLPGKDRRGSWGRKSEEFSADFCLISKRTLTERVRTSGTGDWPRASGTDGLIAGQAEASAMPVVTEYDIFRYHFLLGADWKLCCRKLNMDRGNFFHAVYRIEQKLGRVFRELEPYSLFPIDDYLHGPVKGVRSCLAEESVAPLRPPLRAA